MHQVHALGRPAAPRPQAQQHPAQRRVPRQGRRLRARQVGRAVRRRQRAAADRLRRDEVVQSARNIVRLAQVHEGRRHVVHRLHPRRTDARQADVSGRLDAEPDRARAQGHRHAVARRHRRDGVAALSQNICDDTADQEGLARVGVSDCGRRRHRLDEETAQVQPERTPHRRRSARAPVRVAVPQHRQRAGVQEDHHDPDRRQQKVFDQRVQTQDLHRHPQEKEGTQEEKVIAGADLLAEEIRPLPATPRSTAATPRESPETPTQTRPGLRPRTARLTPATSAAARRSTRRQAAQALQRQRRRTR